MTLKLDSHLVSRTARQARSLELMAGGGTINKVARGLIDDAFSRIGNSVVRRSKDAGGEA